MIAISERVAGEPPAIETPCVKICTIESDGLCAGCGRTLDEIARWASMTPAERHRIMTELPNRSRAE